MSDATRLCALDELDDGEARRFDVEGHRLCVVRIGDDTYIIGDRCSHGDVSLSGGEVEDLTIECPQHGSAFDLRTGAALSLPAVRPVPSYRSSVVDGDVLVELHDPAGASATGAP
ncbi:MAG: non-heme iron oxygenase ferredoxin subunit [Microthrixaceae bacterium]